MKWDKALKHTHLLLSLCLHSKELYSMFLSPLPLLTAHSSIFTHSPRYIKLMMMSAYEGGWKNMDMLGTLEWRIFYLLETFFPDCDVEEERTRVIKTEMRSLFIVIVTVPTSCARMGAGGPCRILPWKLGINRFVNGHFNQTLFILRCISKCIFIYL